MPMLCRRVFRQKVCKWSDRLSEPLPMRARHSKRSSGCGILACSMSEAAAKLVLERAGGSMLLGNFSKQLYDICEHARAEVKAVGNMRKWCPQVGLVYVPGPEGTCGKCGAE